jgi:hypothetical protein
MALMDTLRGQNEQLVDAEAHGTYRFYCLKGLNEAHSKARKCSAELSYLLLRCQSNAILLFRN